MTRTNLPGGGWADAKALASGLLDEATSPVTREHIAVPANTEYLRVHEPINCGCPRSVTPDPSVALMHRDDCKVRHPDTATAPPAPPRLPFGAIPCPECRCVAFVLVPEGRRCHGCGHVWAVAAPMARPETARGHGARPVGTRHAPRPRATTALRR